MAPTMEDVAAVTLARGVDRAHLDRALGLATSGISAREAGLLRSLVRTLLDAGASISPGAFLRRRPTENGTHYARS